ncbi:hypothetical protein OS493_040149, partial [Desmophyllum pertusum]
MPRNDEIEALRNRIMEVLKQEPYMGEKIPIKWLNFERVIEALVAERIYYMNLEHLQRYAREVCFIDDEDEFTTLVNFYHDIGLIIKHCSTVVLKAQWLIDLFKQLITIPPFHKTDPVNSNYWREVERSGVLSMELVDHVFYKFIQQGLVKKDILDYDGALRNQDEAVSVSTSADAEVAKSVRLFVECTLQDLSQEPPYQSGLRYKFCVACPYCLQESHECANHSQPSCPHEDCLHFFEMKPGEQLICEETFSDEVLTVRGLEKWFPQITSQ